MKNRINKSNLNLTIDIIMFVVLVAIAGIGFMIKYVLVPGFKRNEIYGQDVELYFWGLDRHQWGSIHLILSFSLLFLLLLHIIFHWDAIICIFKRMITKKPVRIGLTTILVVFTFIFGVMPLFVRPEVKKAKGHHFYQTNNYNRNHQNVQFSLELDKNQAEETDSILLTMIQTEHFRNKSHLEKERKHKNEETIEIHGYMTLNEVAKKYRLTASELATCIKVPEKYLDERLGRLRKQYDFSIDDLRKYVESKNKLQ